MLVVRAIKIVILQFDVQFALLFGDFSVKTFLRVLHAFVGRCWRSIGLCDHHICKQLYFSGQKKAGSIVDCLLEWEVCNFVSNWRKLFPG